MPDPLSTSTLDTLFAPKSVMIVGASDNPARLGGRTIAYLKAAKFSGAIYPVNPARETVQGLPAFASVDAVPADVDCAVLVVAADAAEDALRACATKGVKTAVVMSAGFAETGADGRARQDRLLAIAHASGIRLLGPNCMGLLSVPSGFYPTFASTFEGGIPETGPIGIVSQSGAYGSYLLQRLYDRGLKVCHWVTTGNEGDVEAGELLLWMARSPDTRVLIAYLEGIRCRETFVAALETARAAGKPVIVMKVGRSDVGAAAAAAHTASLAGDDESYQALLDQYGVYRARTTAELIEVAYAAERGLFPTGRNIGLVTISGGIGIQVADFAAEAGLEMPALRSDLQEQLLAMVPFGNPRNPVDLTAAAANDLSLFGQALEIMLSDEGLDALLIFIGQMGMSSAYGTRLREMFTSVAERYPHRLLAISVMASPAERAAYRHAGLLTFDDIAPAVTSFAALSRFGRSFAQAARALPVRTSGVPCPADGGALNEVEAKAIVNLLGIETPRETLVPPGGDVAAAARAIGYPVVLKIVSGDILHKTDIGGVMLNLTDDAAVTAAAAQIFANVAEHAPAASIEGILVAEMITDALECFIGARRLPVLGPVVVFGMGGVAVELFKDVSRRVGAIDEDEAARMIGEVRFYPLLTGFRGRPALDVPALARAISAVSRFVTEHEDLVETLEINPVAVLPAGRGVRALDAVVEIRPLAPLATSAHEPALAE